MIPWWNKIKKWTKIHKILHRCIKVKYVVKIPKKDIIITKTTKIIKGRKKENEKVTRDKVQKQNTKAE